MALERAAEHEPVALSRQQGRHGQRASRARVSVVGGDAGLGALCEHPGQLPLSDRFEAGGFGYFYDSGDLFRIEGVATDLAGFEAAVGREFVQPKGLPQIRSEIIGGLALRFAVLKAGVYQPLLPVD